MAEMDDPFLTFTTVFPRQLPAVALRTMQMYRQLRAFERFAPARQDALLAAQLNHLLGHAKRHSPFWAERLTEFRPGRKSATEILRSLPVLTRRDFQDHGARMASRFPERDAMGIVTNTTSGSTGTPVSIELSRMLFAPLYHAITLICSAWHGLDPKKPFGVLSAKCQDNDSAPLGPPFSWYGPVANAFQFNTRDREIGEIFDYCARKQPAYLQTGPNTALRLARHAREHGRRDLRIERFLTLGAAVTQETRSIVREQLGAEIIDRYSSEEAGYIALQCPKHDHLHVMSPVTMVEIVDDKGMPSPPGETGRILITSPQGYAMPLLRYDIGDRGEWGEPCDCGIRLPVLKAIHGRTRDIIVTPDGRQTTARIYARDFEDIAGLKEYRFVLHQNAVIAAQIRTTQRARELEEAVIQRIQKAIGFPYPVRIRYVEAIEWGAGWKQEVFAVSNEPAPELEPAR